MVLPRIGDPAFSRNGLLKPGAILDFAEEQIRAYDIRCPGPMARAGSLSGGNLQKALLARELAFDPAVLIAAQPTRGLDIGATGFVHEKFLGTARQGLRAGGDQRRPRRTADALRPHRGDVRGHASPACSTRPRRPSSASAC